MKVALVHDYLNQKGGAERVFQLLCDFFPDADIYTSIYNPQKTLDFRGRSINTTFLQKVPTVSKNFRLFAPLYYPAFRQLDLQKYDLIISSSSSFAKGIKKRPEAMHICLCHNVTRFIWDTNIYLEEYTSFKKYSFFIEPMIRLLKQQDLKFAQEPDLYVANSSTVAQRIERIYNRQAIALNYPIDTSKFIFSGRKEDYYLMSSRMISYKRLDIAVEAFNWLGLPLIIIGDGPERKRLEAKSLDNVQFLGYVEDEWRTHLMAKAKAVIVTALEDYGLVPIEANASGTPVIAYGAGGILDSQVNGKTAILFKHQTPESLQIAIKEHERTHWDYGTIRQHAIDNFSERKFFQQFANILKEFCGESILNNLKIDSKWLVENVLV